MIEKERWFWCELCHSMAIQCKYCGTSSCSGGGCDKCFEEYKLASAMILDGTCPKREDVPVKSRKEDLDKLFGIKS